MRKKILIANWKMNSNLADSQDFGFKLKNYSKEISSVDIVVCPPDVYLLTLVNIFKESNVLVGIQNMYHKEEGAFTGEISPKMVKDINAQIVILGHSERRQYFKETDSEINLKLKAALKHNLIPVFCVGEDLETREKGKAPEWVKKQILEGLKDINSSDAEKIIIAYEPIWAIGTGKICSGEDANKIIKMIRGTIKEKYSEKVSDKVRILYGGSIKSDNFSEHIKYDDIDGGLVGGASLKYDEFIKIINLAANIKTTKITA